MAATEIEAAAAEIRISDLDVTRATTTFADQDSGCLSYRISTVGHEWFVKTALTAEAVASLESGVRFHQAVRHDVIVRPVRAFRSPTITLVYPWMPGRGLNNATTAGSDRSALDDFRTLPVRVVESAIRTVLDAHEHVARAGLIAVDFYDGSLLYDFENRMMRLIDLDEYRPGPFVLGTDRLPGSSRYMAPEEFEQGSTIDQRTNVFTLGRMAYHLLVGQQGWRGSATQSTVIDRATRSDRSERFATVADLNRAWLSAGGVDR